MLSSELTQIPIVEERWFGSKTALIRVLHVDDDLQLLEVSKQILSSEGNFEIENVVCVKDAFQKLSLGRYDIILSDYEMPQKDGLQFLKELKEQKISIPFILFTGKGREEIAIKALNMGAEGYYNKQGDIETVYGELAHGIKKAYQRRKIEEHSREQETLHRVLLDNVPCVAMILEKETRKIIASNKMAQAQGAIPGKTCHETCALRSYPCTFCLAPKLWETGHSQSLEVEYEGKYYCGVWVPYNADQYVHYIFDITDRKKNEESLKESENRFKKIASQMQGMLYQFKKRPDGSYCVPYTSEGIKNIFGCSPEDVREDFSPIAKVILQEDLEKVINSIEESARNLTPWKCEYRVKTSNQTVKHLLGQSIPEKLSDGSILWHGYNFDITSQKAMDQAFLENQEKFHALFNSNPDPAVFYNADFHVVEANPKFCKFFGYSLSELKDRDIADLIVPEERREESKQVRQKALSRPTEVIATRMKKDGSLVTVLMAGGPVRSGDRVIGAMFVYKDISDIITVQEALNLALNKAELLNEKLKVVGSLTRHDVRNKLSTVTGYSYLIKKQHSDLADVVNALNRMEQAVKETVTIFDFAKTYEQIGIENLVDIDVQKAVQEATSMFSDLPFNLANECNGLTVKADSLLRQLIYNLIDNTRKYGKKTTMVKVYYRKTSAGQLQLVYEDDGVGIPNESKGQLFKKGFSTGGTSGFGLFLSKKIIDVYHWNIEEVGEPGKGAKFIITIN